MPKLGTILDVLSEDGVKLLGVNSAYLYFGMIVMGVLCAYVSERADGVGAKGGRE